MKIKRAYNIVPFSTSRESALNEALFPKSIAVDDKNIEDHLNFMAAYSRHVNYYNLEDKKAGDWHSFLGHNDIVFLSHLLQTDVNALHDKKKPAL